ncbi:aldo/keto reductase [Rhodoligotrophos defluvii]|uniref:aldo/keto reductase n=1 Tax=Rhodoligotrophos defluvii TaxID=2561934 RepID=UPI0010C9464B|nr:aldo/keto reductase [Rhodoligotrophos defluvii]
MIYRTIKNTRIPALGFGTFGLNGAEGLAAIECALETGYRHIDAAIRYGNEAEVGQAIASSRVPREEIFLTTKIWYGDLTPQVIFDSTRESLDRLKTDFVDLLLIHWPSPDMDLGRVLDALAELQSEGLARNIGVANFPTALMRACVEDHGADLLTNQVEYHPFLNQSAVYDLCRRYGMLLTAYLPLARGAVMDDPVLQEIAESHGKSAAQVTLRWLLQQADVAAIPRSSKPEHIRSNFDVFDFALSEEEMARIGALRGGGRIVNVEWAPEWDPA